MDSWGWVLLALFTPGLLWGAVPEVVQQEAGGHVLLPCGAATPPLHWVWSPQYPNCAGVTGDLLKIAQLPPGPEPPPRQFRGRLAPKLSISGGLLLWDLVMSDSGTFFCLGVAGAHNVTRLEVTGGCRNNLTVSFKQVSPSALILHCGHCPPLARSVQYQWLLNGRPLGNPRWANKSQKGAVVQLDPTRPAAWGHWECRSINAPSQTFEFCLAPSQEAGDVGLGSKGWIWLMALAAFLVLSGAGLGTWCLWRRRARKRQQAKKKRENKTGTPGPMSCPLEGPHEGDVSSGKSPISRRGEGKVLLYAEVQHPPAVGASPPPRDGATVYATVV